MFIWFHKEFDYVVIYLLGYSSLFRLFYFLVFFLVMNLIQQQIIDQVTLIVKERFLWESSWHDWWHIYRVRKNAINIWSGEEWVDIFVVQLAALLHDIADYKFHWWDECIGWKVAREILMWLWVEEDVVMQVQNIIDTMSFKWGSGVPMTTVEWQVVQDADRLDAIGAIWIARTFAYWWSKWRIMYDPSIVPNLHMTKEEYKSSSSPSLNHFYEKLLLLKDLMNTKTAQKIAQSRHEYMQWFIDQFLTEWEGIV